jgi:hypothetical protein
MRSGATVPAVLEFRKTCVHPAGRVGRDRDDVDVASTRIDDESKVPG